jgi:DNA-binding GntR family transcriptional regulator
MSPEAKAADHVYRQLKADVMTSHYPPSSILNAHQIATEIGVSVTPVRDAMERLVGERLVAPRAGGGFHVPRMEVAALRDLYLWHGHLARWAVTHGTITSLPDELAVENLEARWSDNEALVEDTLALFLAIGTASENAEHSHALRSAGERLHATRLSEWRMIRDQKAELLRLVGLMKPGNESTLRDAVSAYHRRRIRIVPSLIQ